MAELDSWAVGATADRRVGTEDARRAISALLWPGSTPVGITAPGLRLAAGNPGKVAATGTPGATVTVNAFQGFPDLAARPGAYIATLDATKTVDVLGANPADPSNQRNDLIIAQQNDADYGDADRLFTVKRITGTPSGTPADPAVTGSPNYLLLARIRVTAGATSITNAMIDDLRPPFLVALGGVKPVANKAARDLLPIIDGLVIYRQDRDWIEACDGTAWRVQGVAVCTSTSDRDTAITDPYNGLFAFTTDTNTLWVRASGSWVAAPSVGLWTPREAVKSGDTSRTTTTTLTDDPHLSVSLEASAIYAFEFEFIYNAPVATNGFTQSYTVPSGATGTQNGFLPATTGFSQSLPTQNNWNASASDLYGKMFGRIVTTNAGTFAVKWAQNVSNAAAVILRAGSRLTCRRIA